MATQDDTTASQTFTIPKRMASPALSMVIQNILASEGLKPLSTLADIRAALQAEGSTWSAEGELLFPQDRTALVIEIDELIDTYGADAHVCDVVAS